MLCSLVMFRSVKLWDRQEQKARQGRLKRKCTMERYVIRQKRMKGESESPYMGLFREKFFEIYFWFCVILLYMQCELLVKCPIFLLFFHVFSYFFLFFCVQISYFPIFLSLCAT